MDQHQKLRLKVTTNTGLNLMCTVNKGWTIQQLYPHITKLYNQVTEDQESSHANVYLTSLKQNSYFIPKSQIVGDIFVDGDQVSCNVETRKANTKPTKDKKLVKKQKAEEKKIEQQINKGQKPIISKNDRKQDKQKEQKQKKSKSQLKKEQHRGNGTNQGNQVTRFDNRQSESNNQKKQEEKNKESSKEQENPKKSLKKSKQISDPSRPRTIPDKSQIMKVFLNNQHKMEEAVKQSKKISAEEYGANLMKSEQPGEMK